MEIKKYTAIIIISLTAIFVGCGSIFWRSSKPSYQNKISVKFLDVRINSSESQDKVKVVVTEEKDKNKVVELILSKGVFSGRLGDSYCVELGDDNIFKGHPQCRVEIICKKGSNEKNTYSLWVCVLGGKKYLFYCKDTNSDQSVEKGGLFSNMAVCEVEILSCGEKIENMSYMFYNCRDLRVLLLNNLTTIYVTNMKGMFCSCGNLEYLDLSSFDTRRVKNMESMFEECEKLVNLNLRNFDVVAADAKDHLRNIFAECCQQDVECHITCPYSVMVLFVSRGIVKDFTDSKEIQNDADKGKYNKKRKSYSFKCARMGDNVLSVLDYKQDDDLTQIAS